MSRQHIKQQGFSTVELLIALFIAAAFLMTAYQLFGVVMATGNDARIRSRAGNVAYENIRANSGKTTNPCSDTIIPTITNPADLPQASVAVKFECPYGANSRTTRVTATVTYDGGKEKVEGSIDVYK